MTRVMAAAVCALVCVLMGVRAGAQYGPEGNAHPATQAVSSDAADLRAPFGAPKFPSSTSVAGKRALAAAVDLEPLRDVAVFHNGRVKILDTLARETVRDLTGRSTYFDLDAPDAATGGRLKLHYDPLFTLLDVVIDPAYYTDKPLLHVNYLPLREAFLERAFPENPEEVDRWKRLTRLSPEIFEQYRDIIQQRYMSEPAYMDGLSKIDQTADVYRFSGGNFELVAPDRSDLPWKHIALLPADHPVRTAAAQLGAAWRAGNAAGVNEAVARLAVELPKVNSDVYPTTRRALEVTYNRVNAFEWGFYIYFVALVSLILAFGTSRTWLIALGIGTLSLAVGLHAFGFVLRCIIAERFAIQNQFESMVGLSLFGSVLGLGLMLMRRQWLYGAAAAGMGFLVLVTATQTGIPGVNIEREAAILNTSVLLKYHVTTVLVSYALITLGLICSLFYLGTYYGARLKAAATGQPAAGSTPEEISAAALGLEKPQGLQRTLADLDMAQTTVLQLAFWTLGVGILLGAWWADHSWGRWWAFDPKETWSLATWIVYLIVVHLRKTGVSNKGLVTAWLSVVGFFVMLWCYFGVNLLLPGLHAYA